MAKKDKWRKWKASAAGILAAGLALQWLKMTPAFETAHQQVAALDSASGTVDQTNSTDSDRAINDWQNNMDESQFQPQDGHPGHHRDFQSWESGDGSYDGSNSSSVSGSMDSSNNGSNGSSRDISNGSSEGNSNDGFSDQAPSSSFQTRSGGS
ncbi:hypothetical protein EJP77_13440 [Paenibacillus zeisoli]|uniref:Uncharacterized protein n=1 Tax=Paenibacillus zeisoli TaxID=2496267 RepID=A0A433X707_9BACL|nr:hypothetical protein [Paenibacillus zeisoli]RUT29820.1 hypothetical protein EJP77_13440 [Paenibacillus zeisoli]